MLDSVASWAKQNWQLIKPMMIAAQKDEQERYNRLNSAGLGALGRGAAFSSQYKP